MKFPSRAAVLVAALLVPPATAAARARRVRLELPPAAETRGLERLVESAGTRRGGERVAFLAGYFLGRPYTPATKARVTRQRSGRSQGEARNSRPRPVRELPIRFSHADCVTYLEAVLALASSGPDFAGSILPHLLDLRFDRDGGPLYEHQRNHFMSDWARRNEDRGYLRDVTGDFPEVATRVETLNLRDGNRTYYVKDRCLIFRSPTRIRYVPNEVLRAEAARLHSGDILVFASGLPGLDYVHVGFVVRRRGSLYLRHASSSKDRILDQELVPYLEDHPGMLGATVLRPLDAVVHPQPYRFVAGREEREAFMECMGADPRGQPLPSQRVAISSAVPTRKKSGSSR